jgi:hypothetical protein
LSAPFFAAAYYFRARWELWNKRPTVEEALKQDPRPPILYLRPFKADRVRFSTLNYRIRRAISLLPYLLVFLWTNPIYRVISHVVKKNTSRVRKQSAEEFLVSLVDPMGPVIAIGRPKEWTPPIGAARMYLGDEWKGVVCDLMKKSQLILMFAGITPHFAWELQTVFRNDPFVPTILILPFFQRYRQEEVDQFVTMLEEGTGNRISKDLRKTRAVYFARTSEVIEIRDQDTPDERALNEQNPFLGPIAQIMELSRPGWTDGYIGAARENRRANRLWLAGGAAAVLLLLVGSFALVSWGRRETRETEFADQFFGDAMLHSNPCTDPKLAGSIADANACQEAVQRFQGGGVDLCKDPGLADLFPDYDSCNAGFEKAFKRVIPVLSK